MPHSPRILARSRQVRAIALAALLLLIVVGALIAGIFTSQQQSRSRISATFALKGPSAAAFLATYVAQQATREQQTAERFLASASVSSGRFQLVAQSFGSGAALLLDGAGRVLQSAPRSPALIGRPLAGRYPHLATAERGSVAVSNVVRSAVKGIGVVAIATPFATPRGRRVFSAAYSLSDSVLQAFVAHTVAYPQHAVYLIDASGRLIAESPMGSAGSIDEVDPSLARAAARSEGGKVPGARTPSTFTSAPVPGTSWRLLIAVPDSRLYASISGLPQAISWIVLALVTVLGSWLIALFGRSLVARGRVVTQAAIVQTMTEGVILVSRRERILFTNPSLDAIMGYRRGELVNQPWSFVNASPGETDAIAAEIRGVLGSGRPWHGEIQNLRRDRTILWCSVTVTALDHPDFGPVWLAVYADISDRKQAETSADEALAEAVEASRAKSDFVANMSHEIRTPLNGVIGMADLLRDSTLTPVQREQVDALAASGDALLSVIGDVLDFSKIEAGHFELDPTDFDLRESVSESCRLLAEQAEAKGLAIDNHVDADVPAFVTGDRARLRQVLLNLLSNAIKFTPAGEVSIRVSNAGADLLHFAVLDSGVGIDAGGAARLFDAFVQADQSTTREYGGTGLGLAISRQIVERMGGSIGADARELGGSVFWFSAQLPQASGRATPGNDVELVRPAAQADRGLFVLVAEDNEINRKVTQAHLRRLGLRAAIAHNGREAVTMAAGQDYAAIFMDCQMPELDGFEATRRIREAETGRRVPIIAMTALTMPGDRERCLASGMDGYLSKPIRSDELESVIERWLPAEGVDGAASTHGPGGDPLGTRPLVDWDDVLDEIVTSELRETLTAAMRGQLLGVFDRQCEKCIADIADALARGDHGEVRQIAHLLKGSSAGLGAKRLRLNCELLEHSGRREDEGVGHSDVEALRASAAKARRALRMALLGGEVEVAPTR